MVTDDETETTSMAATEGLAHAALRLTADRPGQFGRVKVARTILGHLGENEDHDELLEYVMQSDGWTLQDVVQLLDAMIAGGLLTRTGPPRPTLVLTRAGWRALHAVEAGVADTIPPYRGDYDEDELGEEGTLIRPILPNGPGPGVPSTSPMGTATVDYPDGAS